MSIQRATSRAMGGAGAIRARNRPAARRARCFSSLGHDPPGCQRLVAWVLTQGRDTYREAYYIHQAPEAVVKRPTLHGQSGHTLFVASAISIASCSQRPGVKHHRRSPSGRGPKTNPKRNSTRGQALANGRSMREGLGFRCFKAAVMKPECLLRKFLV